MGVTLLEFIKKTGVFLICAESILHFVPGESYQKYVKVLVGIMVLAQFMIPLKALLSGQEREIIESQILEFQRIIERQSEEVQADDFWRQAVNDEGTQPILLDEQIKNQTIEEIKFRLNGIAVANRYRINDVILNDTILVSVSKEAAGAVKITEQIKIPAEQIKIPKVELEPGKADIPEEEQEGSRELQRLREEFCQALGTTEEYLQVVENK